MKKIVTIIVLFSCAAMNQYAQEKSITDQDRAKLEAIAEETQHIINQIDEMANNKTGQAKEALQGLRKRYTEVKSTLEAGMEPQKGAVTPKIDLWVM